MNLVVDTNRIIAALIKDSISRKILFSGKFMFITLDLSKKEIEKHKDYIIKKADISKNEFYELLKTMFTRIYVLNDIIIKKYMDEAKQIMDNIDEADTPFIAAALAVNSPIWSDDKHFQKQYKVTVFKTEDLNKLI